MNTSSVRPQSLHECRDPFALHRPVPLPPLDKAARPLNALVFNAYRAASDPPPSLRSCAFHCFTMTAAGHWRSPIAARRIDGAMCSLVPVWRALKHAAL